MITGYDWTVVRTSDQFIKFLDWLRSRRRAYVALDTETSSADDLYTPRFRVRLIQLGDTHTSWVLPWDGWGRAAAVAMQEYDGRIVIHNSAFDMAVLARQGIVLEWHRIVDTMLAMRIAEPDLPAALKESCNRHVDPDADLTQADLKRAMLRNNWTWDTVPLDLLVFVEYAALDPILTARLYESAAVQGALASPVWSLEMDTAALCARMADRGMRVDVGLCERQRDRLMSQAAAIRARVLASHDLDVGSPAKCARWLMSDYDALPLMTKVTPGGAPSVDKEVLEKIAVSVDPLSAAADVAQAILDVRSAEKIASAYFGKFAELADPAGMVHPQILTSEARSGRMSVRNPALQTLPKDDSAGVRAAVLPRSSDEYLITSDWDQIEMRLAAIFSQDEGLLGAFREADAAGGDFFTSMGASIYHDPDFKKSDPRRRIVKGSTYGVAYGAGAAKIAATAGIPLVEAQRVLHDIFTTYPGLRTLMRRAESQAKRDGYITTMGGRRLTVPPIASYKALNYLLQGSASVLLKRTLVEMGCAGLEDMLVVPVHDEVVLSVPKDAIEDVRRVVAEVMPITDLPLAIGAEPSQPLDRWGRIMEGA